MVVSLFKIYSVMRNGQCVLMEVGVRQAMRARPEATNLVSSMPLRAAQPSTPSAPLEVNLVSAELDEFFLGSLPLFVSTLRVCEDIFFLLHMKRVLPLLMSPVTRNHATQRTHKKSPFEVLSVMNINRM